MASRMKIGVFDSGLGGLAIARSIRDVMPDHDMIYLGDTLHVPYGSRSHDVIMRYTQQSMAWLFERDCQLIIMACNTASALTLRLLQQNYLRETFPDRRILGVVVPTLETATEMGFKRIGLLATERIVQSAIYKTELEKLGDDVRLFQHAAPLLVSAIEMGCTAWFKPLLRDYLAPILAENVECLILGCTHYVLLRDMIQEECGDAIHVMSQDDIIPAKVVNYLGRHPEIDSTLGRNGTTEFFVTDVTDTYVRNARTVYRDPIEVQKAFL
jgi:glutamate racemase